MCIKSSIRKFWKTFDAFTHTFFVYNIDIYMKYTIPIIDWNDLKRHVHYILDVRRISCWKEDESLGKRSCWTNIHLISASVLCKMVEARDYRCIIEFVRGPYVSRGAHLMLHSALSAYIDYYIDIWSVHCVESYRYYTI